MQANLSLAEVFVFVFVFVFLFVCLFVCLFFFFSRKFESVGTFQTSGRDGQEKHNNVVVP